MNDSKKSDNNGGGRPGGPRTSATDRGLQSVREDLNHLGDTARQTVQDWQEVVRDRLARQPYATLAVAAGVGYVLGGGLPPFVIRTLVFAGGRLAVENLIAQRVAQ